MPKVTIILVNYNGISDTRECLRSLAEITYQPYDVIVVDNGSRDIQEAHELQKSFLGVTVIRSEENKGFAGGNNIGIRVAQERGSDYVLLLNNDTVAEPKFLDAMVAAAEADARIGMVGAKIYFHSDPETLWYDGGSFSWRKGVVHENIGTRDKSPNDAAPRLTDFITGCAMLVRMSAVEKIGLLEESFFMYHEDVDWCLRARTEGFLLVIAPAAHVWHKVARSASQMGEPKIHYYDARNSLLLVQRNAPPLVRVWFYGRSVLHFAKQIVKILILPSKRAISKMIMRGIVDFYRGTYGKLQE
ncbi:glycosyltransferase family 2 protein [Candidatus Azambacteria bacterium]|nr:glycosyltransferase family 2 protein [Candidatus Azambacteria bacterium]